MGLARKHSGLSARPGLSGGRRCRKMQSPLDFSAAIGLYFQPSETRTRRKEKELCVTRADAGRQRKQLSRSRLRSPRPRRRNRAFRPPPRAALHLDRVIPIPSTRGMQLWSGGCLGVLLTPAGEQQRSSATFPLVQSRPPLFFSSRILPARLRGTLWPHTGGLPRFDGSAMIP